MAGCRKCNGRGFRESRDGLGVDLCGDCDAHALNKAEMAKAAVRAVALTRAVEAWRGLSQAQRNDAIEIVSRESAFACNIGLPAEHTALWRAADLLRAAGGKP